MRDTTCLKCKAEIPEQSTFCCVCGKKQQEQQRKPRTRGNGQGSVYKLSNGSWRAEITIAFSQAENGKTTRKRKTKSGFKTKKEALAYLPQLRTKTKIIDPKITLKELYALWLPTHKASKSTLGNYQAAFNHFKTLWFVRLAEIGIDDLQESIDSCTNGIRTRQAMKTTITLMYKYALPRGYLEGSLNLGNFVRVGEGKVGTRSAFTLSELEKIKNAIGSVPYADYIYCMIYTGFRPFEFLALEIKDYDRREKCFTGGGKTEAGTNRLVTISPKIQPIIDALTCNKLCGVIFCNKKGSRFTLNNFREIFYNTLNKIGIKNTEHRLTPYSTRHTFATLLKQIETNSKDKLELMGHTSEEMLRHYQHTNYTDLRKITDII